MAEDARRGERSGVKKRVLWTTALHTYSPDAPAVVPDPSKSSSVPFSASVPSFFLSVMGEYTCGRREKQIQVQNAYTEVLEVAPRDISRMRPRTQAVSSHTGP